MAKTYTFKEKAPFQYRFSCEHCGKQTDWLDAHIEEQETKQVGLFESAEGHRQAFSARFWENTYPKARKALEGNEKTLYVYDINGTCPACGKHQSWESKTADRPELWIGMAIFCFVVGLICIGVWISGTSSPGFPLITVTLVSVIGFPISLFYAITSSIKKAAISRDAENVKQQNKPEFLWPKDKEG